VFELTPLAKTPPVVACLPTVSSELNSASDTAAGYCPG